MDKKEIKEEVKETKKDIKETAKDIKEEATKVAEKVEEKAKKVYSENEETGEKILEFVKNNAGMLLGILIGLILVATKLSRVLLDLLVIIAAGLLGVYIQGKIDGKNKK